MPQPPISAFHDPAAIISYASGARRQVPGYDAMLQMTGILLAEHLPPAGYLLIVGAGGG
jgi:tRNA (cmo5U34)-methyltransferase